MASHGSLAGSQPEITVSASFFYDFCHDFLIREALEFIIRTPFIYEVDVVVRRNDCELQVCSCELVHYDFNVLLARLLSAFTCLELFPGKVSGRHTYFTVVCHAECNYQIVTVVRQSCKVVGILSLGEVLARKIFEGFVFQIRIEQLGVVAQDGFVSVPTHSRR